MRLTLENDFERFLISARVSHPETFKKWEKNILRRVLNPSKTRQKHRKWKMTKTAINVTRFMKWKIKCSTIMYQVHLQFQ